MQPDTEKKEDTVCPNCLRLTLVRAQTFYLIASGFSALIAAVLSEYAAIAIALLIAAGAFAVFAFTLNERKICRYCRYLCPPNY